MSEDHSKATLLTVSVVSLTCTCAAIYNLKQRRRQRKTQEVIQVEDANVIPPCDKKHAKAELRRFEQIPTDIDDNDDTITLESKDDLEGGNEEPEFEHDVETDIEPEDEPEVEAEFAAEVTRRGAAGDARLSHVNTVDYRKLYEARLDRVSFLEEELRQSQVKLFNQENLSKSYQTRIQTLQNEKENFAHFTFAEIASIEKQAQKKIDALHKEVAALKEALQKKDKELQDAGQVTEGIAVDTLEVKTEEYNTATREANNQVPAEMSTSDDSSLSRPELQSKPVDHLSEVNKFHEAMDERDRLRLGDAAVLLSIVSFIFAW